MPQARSSGSGGAGRGLENAIELSSGDESSSDDQPIVLAPTKKRSSSGPMTLADRPVPRPAVHGSAGSSKKRSAAAVPLSSESEELPDLHFGAGFKRDAPVAKLPQRSRSDGHPKPPATASSSVKREASGSGARDSAVPAPRRAPVVHVPESDEDVKVQLPAVPPAPGFSERFSTIKTAVRVDDAVQALTARGKEVKVTASGSMLNVTTADDDEYLGEIKCRALLPFFNGVYPVQHRAFLLASTAAGTHGVAIDLIAHARLTETYRRKIKNIVFNEGASVTFLSRKGQGPDAAKHGADTRAAVAAEPCQAPQAAAVAERARLAEARLQEALAVRQRRHDEQVAAAAAAHHQPLAGPSGVKHEGDVKPEVPAIVAAAQQGLVIAGAALGPAAAAAAALPGALAGPAPRARQPRRVLIDGEFVEIEDDDPAGAAFDGLAAPAPGSEMADMLRNMAQGEYHGNDALGALYDEKVTFDVAHLPKYADTDALKARGLKAELYPHQLQGLRWMVEAEHRTLPQEPDDEPVMLYAARKDARGGRYWYHMGLRESTRRPPPLPRGGILSDGMGLGKTMQVVALIISDCDDPSAARGADVKPDVKSDEDMKSGSDTEDDGPAPKKRAALKGKGKAKASNVKKEASGRAGKGKARSFVKKESRRSRSESNDSDSYTESGSESDELLSSEDDTGIPDDDPDKPWTHTNLIVMPLSILTQWKDQIALHTSGVRVLVYHGPDVVKKYKTFKNYDIVLTTYDTLKNQHRVLAEKRELEKRKELYEEAMLALQEEKEAVEARRPQATTAALLASVDADLELIADRMKEEKRFLKHGPVKKKGKPGRPSKKAKKSAKAKGKGRAYSTDSDFGNSEEDDYMTDDSFIVDKRKDNWKKNDWVGPLFTTRFRRCVLDEAHIARNPKTGIYLSILDVQAQRKWSLTGTPIVNGTKDLGSLVAWHGLEPFASEAKMWNKVIEKPLKSNVRLGGTLLKAVVRALILRRVKSMKDDTGAPLVPLPPITVYEHSVPLRPDDRVYYDKCEEALKGHVEALIETGELARMRSFVLVFLVRLRQLACHRGLVSPNLLEELKSAKWTTGEKDGDGPAAALDQATIELLQEQLAAVVSLNEDCPICFTALAEKTPVITACRHAFCRECIETVMNSAAPLCPLDRRALPKGSHLIELPAARAGSEDSTESDVEDWTMERGSAKLDEIVRIILGLEAQDPTEKVVVFSNFKKHLDIVAKRLEMESVPYCRLDGSMNKERREKSIASFNRPIDPDDLPDLKPVVGGTRIKTGGPTPSVVAMLDGLTANRRVAGFAVKKKTRGQLTKREQEALDESEGIGRTIPRVFLITIGAGSLGLNLTAASTCIIIDPWWQSAITDQATDRIHRMGQTRDCKVFHFVSEGTIENRMQEIQKAKEALTMKAFEGVTSHGKRIAAARDRRTTGLGDLAALLNLSPELVRRAERLAAERA